MLELIGMALLSSVATYLFIKRKETKRLGGFKVPEIGIELQLCQTDNIVLEAWSKQDFKQLAGLNRTIAESLVEYYINNGLIVNEEEDNETTI